MKASIWLHVLAIGFMVHCSDAYSQQADYQGLTIEEALQFCAAFMDDDERLACFEALAASTRSENEATSVAKSVEEPDPEGPVDEAAPPSADASAELAERDAADESDVADEADSKSRFTFVRSSEAEAKQKERKRFELTVYKAWRNAVGELRVAFTNGEIWIQSGQGSRYTPQPGEQILFKPGLLGGWTLSMDGGRFGIRGRRLNKDD